ncbi:hypothetical protein RDI58_025807 [Solanum bulbocastanum]|uniref:Uncharacterized protein n=1 Tax=Solanum bulbocastanum TaxID=147425 RepID=A0AAN8T3N8_SOLBU
MSSQRAHGSYCNQRHARENVEADLCKDDVDGEDVEMPHDKLELSDSESDARQGESLREKVPMELLKAITAAPALSLDRVMDEWIEKGNDLTRTEITFIRIYLP